MQKRQFFQGFLLVCVDKPETFTLALGRGKLIWYTGLLLPFIEHCCTDTNGFIADLLCTYVQQGCAFGCVGLCMCICGKKLVV